MQTRHGPSSTCYGFMPVKRIGSQAEALACNEDLPVGQCFQPVHQRFGLENEPDTPGDGQAEALACNEDLPVGQFDQLRAFGEQVALLISRHACEQAALRPRADGGRNLSPYENCLNPLF